MKSTLMVSLLALGVSLLCGCSSTGAHWGERASLVPGTHRVQRGFLRAVRDPQTWVPAAGAAVFAIGDLDERVSDWASEETPLFGSIENADRWSARLRNINRIAGPATILATDSGTRVDRAAWNKVRGAAVNASAIAGTSFIVDWLKTDVGRKRPNGVNRRSFPSDRAAEAAVGGAIARQNLDWVRMPHEARKVAQAGLTTTSLLAAWGRVEAKAHYPSDVLVGLALGNFLARFTHETFIGHPTDARVGVGITPRGDGVGIQVSLDR